MDTYSFHSRCIQQTSLNYRFWCGHTLDNHIDMALDVPNRSLTYHIWRNQWKSMKPMKINDHMKTNENQYTSYENQWKPITNTWHSSIATEWRHTLSHETQQTSLNYRFWCGPRLTITLTWLLMSPIATSLNYHICRNQWKSMNTNANHMKINEHQWKSYETNENRSSGQVCSC